MGLHQGTQKRRTGKISGVQEEPSGKSKRMAGGSEAGEEYRSAMKAANGAAPGGTGGAKNRDPEKWAPNQNRGAHSCVRRAPPRSHQEHPHSASRAYHGACLRIWPAGVGCSSSVALHSIPPYPT